MAENRVQVYEQALQALQQGLPSADVAPERGRPAEAPEHPSVAALLERFGDAIVFWEVVAGDEHVVCVRPERSQELLRWPMQDPSQRYIYTSDVTSVDHGGGRPIQLVYQRWSMALKRQQ